MQLAFRETKYYISEGIKGMFHNFLMTLASVITVTGCLLFLAVFLIFTTNISYIADQIREDCKIQAYIDINSTDDEISTIKSKIENIEGVAAVELETKEQAFENYKDMLGSDAVYLDDMDNEDFLRDSCKVTLHDLSQSAQIIKSIKAVSGVADVRERQDITTKVFNVTKIIKTMLTISMVLLGVIAIFIISNTIKLAVFSRENEIHIMKYVGATDWFIRWPFIIEGIIVGIIGGGISLLISSAAYKYITGTFANSGIMDIFQFRSIGFVLPYLTIMLLIFGSLMGAVGSVIAVRKHLRV